MPKERIYLDHAASTPVDPHVLDSMTSYFTEDYGNPSSVHRWGQRAEAAVERARKSIAQQLNATEREVLFTSGGTESDNLAIRGAARVQRQVRGASRIITTPVEHPAVLRTMESLAQYEGFELQLLPVDKYGRVDPQELQRALGSDIALVSVIYGNNEIGTVNPIRELGALCREHQVPFHTDAVQATGQMPVDVKELNVDLMSISGHKIYGPKGIGALYLRTGLQLIPVLTGGSHEQGYRAGTLSVPLIVGFAKAMEIATASRTHMAQEVSALRDLLIEGVLESIEGAKLTGSSTGRLHNHASFVFESVESNQLLAGLDLAGFACSAGSACKTGNPEPSSVLLALGYPHHLALSSLRVTLGRKTTEEEIREFLSALPELIQDIRNSGASDA